MWRGACCRLAPIRRNKQSWTRLRQAWPHANTFGAVADEWLAKMEREGLSPVSMKKLRWFLSFLVPVLGKRPISQISPHELLAALQAVEKRGKHETAKRMRATCSQIFRYAIATARCDRDVAHDLKGALTAPR
jgi:integrase